MVGAGNLATHLAPALNSLDGVEVVQVWSRTQSSALLLADKLGCEAVTDVADVTTDADVYVMSVKDDVIGVLADRLCEGRAEAVFVHTAGSVDMGVFEDKVRHYGVLYPMQTFSKSRQVDFAEIPVFIEASDSMAMGVVSELSGVSRHVTVLSSADRRYLHLAAVFACNFANHCYAQAARVLGERNIDFDVMLPLIDETARKVHQLSPLEAQTGPAIRYDEQVMEAQKQLIDDPQTRALYEMLSKSIHAMYAEKQHI